MVTECGGEVLYVKPNHGVRRWRGVQEMAVEDLMTGLAEVLRQEGVEDGVQAGMSVGQTVGDDSKDEGSVVQRKEAELHPHHDDVVRQPAEGEGGDHHQDRLSCLQ